MLSLSGCGCASDDQDVAVLQVEATRRARSLRLSVDSESVLSASLKPFFPSNITLLSRSMDITLK